MAPLPHALFLRKRTGHISSQNSSHNQRKEQTMPAAVESIAERCCSQQTLPSKTNAPHAACPPVCANVPTHPWPLLTAALGDLLVAQLDANATDLATACEGWMLQMQAFIDAHEETSGDGTARCDNESPLLPPRCFGPTSPANICAAFVSNLMIGNHDILLLLTDGCADNVVRRTHHGDFGVHAVCELAQAQVDAWELERASLKSALGQFLRCKCPVCGADESSVPGAGRDIGITSHLRLQRVCWRLQELGHLERALLLWMADARASFQTHDDDGGGTGDAGFVEYLHALRQQHDAIGWALLSNKTSQCASIGLG